MYGIDVMLRGVAILTVGKDMIRNNKKAIRVLTVRNKRMEGAL